MINKINNVIIETVKPIPFKGHPEIHHNEVVETFRKNNVLDGSNDGGDVETGTKLNIVI